MTQNQIQDIEEILLFYQSNDIQMTSPKERSLKSILSIESFKVEEDEIRQIYQRAYALPQFFINNLVSDSRVVKYFQGTAALVVAFYYQLMKLALQIEEDEVSYRQILIQKLVHEELFCEGELEDQIFTDFQYRKFFKDFIEIVEKDSVPSFEKTADKYPIIDEILIKMFKKIIPYPLVMEIQNEDEESRKTGQKIIKILCDQFQVTLNKYGKCFKFEQSDTFLYFENPKEVFLAFNQSYQDELEEESNFTSTFQCGKENSFLTKYHPEAHKSIPKQTISISSFTKPFSEEIANLHPKTEQYFNKKQSQQKKFGQITNQIKQVSSISQFSPAINSLNKFLKSKQVPKTISMKVDCGNLYSQFTNSFILKQMPTTYRDRIQQIKGKYKQNEKRESLKGYF